MMDKYNGIGVFYYNYHSNLMINILSDGALIYESDDYNILFDKIYEDLFFDFYFLNTYFEQVEECITLLIRNEE